MKSIKNLFPFLGLLLLTTLLFSACSKDNNAPNEEPKDDPLIKRVQMTINGKVWKGERTALSKNQLLDVEYIYEKKSSKHVLYFDASNTNGFGVDYAQFYGIAVLDNKPNIGIYTFGNNINKMDLYITRAEYFPDGSSEYKYIFSNTGMPFTINIKSLVKISEDDENIKYRIRGTFSCKMKKMNTTTILTITDGIIE